MRMYYYIIPTTGDWCMATSKRSALYQFSASLRRDVTLKEVIRTTANQILLKYL